MANVVVTDLDRYIANELIQGTSDHNWFEPRKCRWAIWHTPASGGRTRTNVRCEAQLNGDFDRLGYAFTWRLAKGDSVSAVAAAVARCWKKAEPEVNRRWLIQENRSRWEAWADSIESGKTVVSLSDPVAREARDFLADLGWGGGWLQDSCTMEAMQAFSRWMDERWWLFGTSESPSLGKSLLQSALQFDEMGVK